jgi:hypothetical protein
MRLSLMGISHDSLSLRHGDHAGDRSSGFIRRRVPLGYFRRSVPAKRARRLRFPADPGLLRTPRRSARELSQVIRYRLPPRRGAATFVPRRRHDARRRARRWPDRLSAVFHRILAPLSPGYCEAFTTKIAPRSRSASGLRDIHIVWRGADRICRVMSSQRGYRMPRENPTRRYI